MKYDRLWRYDLKRGLYWRRGKPNKFFDIISVSKGPPLYDHFHHDDYYKEISWLEPEKKTTMVMAFRNIKTKEYL